MMMRFRTTLTRIAAGLLVALVPLSICHAQHALFDQNTDTIAILGETSLFRTATFEAVVSLSDTVGSSVYREQGSSDELKSLTVSASSLAGFAKFSMSDPGGFSAAATISLNTFHHIAFVCDYQSTIQQRLYLDGVLIGSHSDTTASVDIDDSASAIHPPAIGASQVNSTNAPVPGFIGLLESVRLSSIVRYVGSSFSAPTGDLSADSNTLLLYNFNPAEVTGSIVADVSGNGHAGVFGTGFSGASAPAIVPRGDLNFDGRVDGADYVAWRNDPGSFAANAYSVWRANFGSSISGSGAAQLSAVPEPAFFALLAIGLIVCALRRRNCKIHRVSGA